MYTEQILSFPFIYYVLAIEIKDCNLARSECLNIIDEKLNSGGLPGSTWSHPEVAWMRLLCRDILKTMTKKIIYF
jgi:hypothetical protein